jgi:hypothetical protein
MVSRWHWRKCLHCCHSQNSALSQHYTYWRFGSTLEWNANSNKNRISLPRRSKLSREHFKANHTTWSGFSCKGSKNKGSRTIQEIQRHTTRPRMKCRTTLNWYCSQQSIQVIHHSYPLLFGSCMFWSTRSSSRRLLWILQRSTQVFTFL